MQSAVSPLTVRDLRGGPLGICRAFVSCCFFSLLRVDLCGSIALVSESLRILATPTPSSKCFRPSKLQAFLLGVYPQAWPTPEAFLPRLLIQANLLPKRRHSPLLALALHPPYRPRQLILLQVGQITVLFLLLYRHFPLLFHRSLSRLFPALSTRPFPQGPLAPNRLLHCRFYINRSWWALVFLLYRQN